MDGQGQRHGSPLVIIQELSQGGIIMPLDTRDVKELIQETIQSLLLQKLEQESIAFQLGARVFQTAAPISVPKLVGNYSPSWVGENEQIPEDGGVGFDAVKLMNSSMKSVKSLIRLSNESLRSASVSLESVLQDRLLRDVASKIDSQFFSAMGDGVTTPQGLLAWEGTQTLTVTNMDFDVDNLLAASATALSSYVKPESVVWVMSPAAFSRLRGLKYDDGRYVLQTDLTSDATYRLLGSPVKLTDRLAENVIVHGDFSAVAVAQDASPTTVVDTSRYLEYDQVAIRVASRYDFKPLDPNRLVVLKKSE